MQATLQYIKEELTGLYPENEIAGFSRIIIEDVCGWNYSAQILKREELIPDSDFKKVKSIVDRLKKYEPIQYILGQTIFYGLKIKVNPSVLIPRPETEELVDWILKSSLPENCKILDIGTGSGCIALALKKNLPNSKILAIDVSEEALKTAKNNAAENDLEVNFYEADIINPDKIKLDRFDIIVSNPPYVREIEKNKMNNNVLHFEPELALFVSDDDPLIFYRSIVRFAGSHLKDNGRLFFEINEELGNEMITLLQKYGFYNIEIRNDIHGKNRMLCCQKNS